ncbi:MAG: hypothetical protein AAFR04_14475, partial [Pseudomonadota bacterium]
MTALGALLALPAQAQSPRKTVMIVFDGSGSMWGAMTGAKDAKFFLGRKGLSQAFTAMRRPQSINAGIFAFGHRRKGSCDDASALLEPTPLEPKAVLAPLQKFNPKGKGPLTLALTKMAASYPSISGLAGVIVIHDGADNCRGDPCAFASRFTRSHPGVPIQVVSLGLKPAAVEAVRCLADRTGGSYQNVTDAAQAPDAVAKAWRTATQGLRGFRIADAQPLIAPDGRPDADGAARGPQPIPAGRAGVDVTARLAGAAGDLDVPLEWSVFKVGQQAKPDTPPLLRIVSPRLRYTLPPGRYRIAARRDLLTQTRT